MDLATLWYVLFVAIIGGYVILDGFDLGVGMLLPVAARTDRERRILLNSIGPVWDGNEVWLVLGGGALFAAFPLVYASLFSGLYIAMMLVLLVLILRTVAIEFRSKRDSTAWRSTWDWVFALASLGITLLLGVALGNVVQGFALGADGVMDVSVRQLLDPYALLFGVTALAMLTLHGAMFGVLKTEDELQTRLLGYVPRLFGVFFVLMTALIAWTLGRDDQFARHFRDRPWTIVFPVLALGAVAIAWRLTRAGRHLGSFFASAMMVASLVAAVAAGMYPAMLRSTVDPAFDLTVHNAASASETLTVMTVVAVIGLPFVFLYTAGVYWFFRGKVVLDDESY
ncbi:MAG: cytochrome d ubiquinol oxidase subunit II [Acidimicrobiia bacterium]|nr:cytochrome d ubiquinol oxidase subunit II [Acidimicrobiia bacterium]